MGTVEDLFQEFVMGGEARIKRAVEEAEPESLSLDFKVSKSESGAMLTDDRRNLGKNLSGFANASGGILVWGIESKSLDDRNAQGLAISLKPIPNIARFLDDLNSQAGQVVVRPIKGVQNHAVTLTDGSGYAVTLIPESAVRPHMSMASDDKRYYLRSGSQTLAIDHVMVEALMHMRHQTKLELYLEQKQARQAHHGRHLDAVILLRNAGEAAARDVVISLRGWGVKGTYHGDFDLKSSSCVKERDANGVEHQGYQFWTPPGRVIHPGTVIYQIALSLAFGAEVGPGDLVWSIYSDAFNGSGTLSLA